MDEPKPMRELTRIRQEQGLSQQRLADASGVNKATINQIERGRRSPNVETLERLASALNAEIADFFPQAEAPLWSGGGTERRSELAPVAAFLHAQMGARLADVWGPELEEREEAGDLQWMMRVAGIMDDYGKVLNELLKNTTFPDKETAETIAFMAMDLNAFLARVQEAMPRVKEAQKSEVRTKERARR
jgi:transcriptional regulator with XRE-family HTH domain